MLPRNKSLKQPARELRKNMTDAERKLWSKIRRRQIRGLQFYRHYVIGNYIVDFYCRKTKLVIEVDGGQHFTRDGRESNESRDAYLQSLGLRVLRFNNREVLTNTEGVVGEIIRMLNGTT